MPKKKVFIIPLVVICVAVAGYFYYGYSKRTFTLDPSLASPGQSVTIRATLFGDRTYQECNGWLIDAKDPQGNDAYLSYMDFPLLEPETWKPKLDAAHGFTEKSTYDELQRPTSPTSLSAGYQCLGQRDYGSWWTAFFKRTEHVIVETIFVLPGTPPGVYQISIGNNLPLALTVQ